MKRIAAFLCALGVALFPMPGRADMGPDYVASSNVKFIKNFREVTDGVGARVVGNYLYVTSSKGLHIFDISTPADPKAVGLITVQPHWENEQVPTNGRLLGLSSSDGCARPDPAKGAPNITPAIPPAIPPSTLFPNQRSANCLSLYDVTNKASPVFLTSVWGAGGHTSTCVFDCKYMWDSNGVVTDLRHVMEPGHPARIIGNWQTGLPGKSPHNQTEIAPGLVLTATQPFMLLSARAIDGGSVTKPRLLAAGISADNRFIHSSFWPRHGLDRFALIGGETNGEPDCSVSGAFMTWDAANVRSQRKFTMIDEYRVKSGNYLDGNPPVHALGCSVHWFEEHRTFHNGGLVALATYENGTRFLQIDAKGKIHEVGYIETLGGSASAPHWAPDGKTLYIIDYARGMDVVQWLGPTYVPKARH